MTVVETAIRETVGTPIAILRDICKFDSGGTPDRANPEFYGGTTPWISGADIAPDGSLSPRSQITDLALSRSAARVVDPGTILLVTRTSVGKVTVAPYPVSFSQDITAIAPSPETLDTNYLVEFLKSQQHYFNRNARGATIKGITRDVVGNLTIPIPPLLEQRRIAAILDKADRLRTQRREALAHLNALTQSIFSSMFHAPGQQRTSLGELLSFVTSGGRGWAKYYSDSGSRFIRSLDVQRNVVNEDTAIFVSAPNNAEAKRTKVQTDDVLLTITGSLIGRAAPVLSSSAGAFISQHVAILRPITANILPVYLSYFLNQENGGQRIIENMQYGQTKPGLNFEQIRKFELPLPPLELQQIFARRVAGVERLKGHHRTQLAELDTLFASLQHRAFKGDL